MTTTHISSVDQSDRRVPYNLRQSGATPVQMLINTRIRKSPFWHLAAQAGMWRATVCNRTYHPFGYIRLEDGGPTAEYHAVTQDVAMWDAAVERQIMVKGPDAECFVDYVITRDAAGIPPMRGRYAVLCNTAGGVLNDPVLLRLSADEFWFSLSDSDIGMYLQGVNHDRRFNVVIDEIDVCPLHIQGPKAHALMRDLIGARTDVDGIPYYGLAEVQIAGCDCVILQTGFSGARGFEIYLRDATLHAETLWDAVLNVGRKHNLAVTAPSHCRRIQAGVLSWGQDMDFQHNPFQCNLGYHVSLSSTGVWNKKTDYIGKVVLEQMRAELRAGNKPYQLQLVGLVMGGAPVCDFAADFWPLSPADGGKPCGFITSPWYHPERKTNIAMGYVPFDGTLNKNGLPVGREGARFWAHLPDEYAETPGRPVAAEVVPIPFSRSHFPNIRERSDT